MSAENNITRDNIFINFQLTQRRGEICKEVRKAKKEGIVKSYEIDANGRIFVKYVGPDNRNKEIFDKNDIYKHSWSFNPTSSGFSNQVYLKIGYSKK